MASPRDSVVFRDTGIPWLPFFRGFWPRPGILQHNLGLAASPQVCYRLEVEGSSYSPFRAIVCNGRMTSSCSAPAG
ncbi:hypothetical protein FAIPA1_50197 [Frankia sp. AiPs1]